MSKKDTKQKLRIRTSVTGLAAAGMLVPAIGFGASAATAVDSGPTDGVEVRWALTDDWASGFQASAEVTNHSASPLDPWQVHLTYQQQVNSVWDGTYAPETDGFSVAGPSWSKSLQPGATAKFGLVGNRLVQGSLAPSACTVAGTTCVVTGEGVPAQSPVPTPIQSSEPTPTQTPEPTPTQTPSPAPTQTGEPTGVDGLTVALENSSDWGSGRTVNATVNNNGSTATKEWSVSMPWSGSVSGWSAKTNVKDGQLTAKNVAWNGAIAPGANTTFGFTDTSAAMPNPTTCVAKVDGTATNCVVVVKGATQTPAPDPTTPAPVPTVTTPAPALPPNPTESAQPTPTPNPTENTDSPGAPKPSGGKKSVAYYTAWSTYARNYQVTDIPADQVTHINYAFANVADGKCALGDSYADTDKAFAGDSWDAGSKRGNFNQLNKLKQSHPKLQTLISVGGWTWSQNFSAAASTESSRAAFSTSCVQFMKDYGFNGIDIDWEYPVSGGLHPGVPADKHNYTLLLQSLRDELEKQGAADGKDYLLTIAAPAGASTQNNLESDSIGDIVDWINVMAYDFSGPWEGQTGHNAPLNQGSADTHPGLNVDSAVSNYLANGVPAKKLVIGVPFYGRSFSGVPNSNGGLFQTHTGAGPGTWEAGSVDYHDVVENYLGSYTRYWDDEAKVPYLYDPASNTYVTYDDPQSMEAKGAYINEKGLGGAMIWELSSDTNDNALLDALNTGM